MYAYLQLLVFFGAIASVFFLSGHMAYRNINKERHGKRAAPFGGGGDRATTIRRGIIYLFVFAAAIGGSMFISSHGYSAAVNLIAVSAIFAFLYAATKELLPYRALAVLAAFLAVASWFCAENNVILAAASYVIVFSVLYVLRSVTMKYAIIILSILIVYDVFMSLLCEHMAVLSNAMENTPAMIEAPALLPIQALGMADVMLPGVFIMTAFRESYIRRLPSLAILPVVGYFLGLGIGIYVSAVWISQPGMLYINPAIVFGLVLSARWNKIPLRDLVLAP